MVKNKCLEIILLILIILASSNNLIADDWQRIVNLKGWWRFSIGDNPEWASPDYNDNNWEEIYVPSSWEDEGFYGYNGYAWYRTQFELSPDFNEQIIYISLGFIDDVDEVYLNGNLIGSTGSFPPNYQTAYNAFRRYPVPVSYLKIGKQNHISVRVYDARLSGGIVSGDIGLYSLKSFGMDINLAGIWKFQTGDNLNWSEKNFVDKGWHDIIVPSNWEIQGFKDYDGYAWYRREFNFPSKIEYEKMVLVLGKIDDLDEVYLNGQLIGSTGNLLTAPYEDFEHEFHNEWQQFRGYYIPEGILVKNKTNVISVRVYDGYMGGGIYQGPVGLITQERYIEYWKSKKKKKNFWDLLFGD